MSKKVNTDDIFAAINLGGSEMEERKQSPPKKPTPNATSRMGRPRSEKVQVTFRMSPDLLARLDQEVSTRKATPGFPRSQASLGPVAEDLLWKALGHKT